MAASQCMSSSKLSANDSSFAVMFLGFWLANMLTTQVLKEAVVLEISFFLYAVHLPLKTRPGCDWPLPPTSGLGLPETSRPPAFVPLEDAAP